MKSTCEKVCESISRFHTCLCVSQVHGGKVPLIKGWADGPQALVLPGTWSPQGLGEHGLPHSSPFKAQGCAVPDSALAALSA